MAEEPHKPAAAAAAPEGSAPAVEPAVSEVSPSLAAEVVVSEKEVKAPPVVEPEAEKETETEGVSEVAASEAVAEMEKISSSVSFKEESNVVGELPDLEKKALDELKVLVQEALNKHEFTAPPAPPPVKEEEKKEEVKEEAEEKKKEVKEEEKKEEVKEEEKKEEVKEAAAEPPPAVEETKSEPEVVTPPPPVEVKEDEKVAPPPVEAVEAVVVAEVVETVTVVDEDGAKTVEAIEETIVAVVAPAEETKEEEVPAVPPPPPEEVFIWGIPLLGDERSDVILLKFLRARDFKVKEAFTMIKNTVRWREEFGIESVLEEDFGNQWDKVVFMDGFDKEGHPVCYNVYGEFQNKELYQNTFSDEEKRLKFLKWRIQFLEKSIRKLDFSPTGISTFVQVNDIKNSPLLAKKELRQTTNQALQLLQDNYPEFVAKQVFVNVPWWYLAFNRMISPFLTQRTKSKFVFAGPSKTAETLFKYIAPEFVPLQYGGLSQEGEQEFTSADSVTEVTIKPSSKHTVDIPASEKSLLVWELRVLGWEVSYGAEFVPSAEDGYTVIVQKTRKITAADEPVISNSFKIGESGKIVLTIDNQTSKKKKLLYRFKIKPSSDC